MMAWPREAWAERTRWGLNNENTGCYQSFLYVLPLPQGTGGSTDAGARGHSQHALCGSRGRFAGHGSALHRHGDRPPQHQSIQGYEAAETYQKLLDEIQPELVITYSIKPNIYMGSACKAKGIPYVINVQGLGTAFEKPVLSSVVSVMYRSALRNAKAVFFETRRTHSSSYIKTSSLPSR